MKILVWLGLIWLYFFLRYNITTDDAPREFNASNNDE